MTSLAYKQLEDQITKWGFGQDIVLAAIVVGSRGRPGEPDAYADLDLIVFANDVTPLITNAGWISDFSTPWLTHLDQTAGQDPEWFIIVEGGLKVDVLVRQVFLPGNLKEWLELFPHQNVLARGYRLLFDKSDAENLIPVTVNKDIPDVDFVLFQNYLEKALVSIHRAAKFAIRGELWQSQHEIARIRGYLLDFYEWQALVETNGMVDTWYNGRHVETWLNNPALDSLPELFPSYNKSELLNALSVFLDELIRASKGTAKLLDFPAPDQGLLSFQTWLRNFIETGTYN